MTTFRRLLGYLRPYRGLFAMAVACAGAAALFDTFSLVLLIPFLRSLFGMGEALPAGGRNAAEGLLDAVVGDLLRGASGLEALRDVCLVLLAAFLLKNLFLYGARALGAAVEERVERDLRDELYAHLQGLPLGFFGRTRGGQLVSRVLSDAREARAAVTSALADALRRTATAAAYLAAMLALSWRLTLLALALAPVYVLVLGPVLRRLRSGFRSAYEEKGELVSVLQETVSGIRLVKAYGAEDYERRRFEENSEEYAGSLTRTRAFSEMASPLSESVSAAIALALVWVGASLVLGGGPFGAPAAGAEGAAGTAAGGAGAAGAVLGPEQFLAFVLIAARLIVPVKSLSRFPARVQASLAAADRVFEVLDEEPEPATREAGAPGAAADRDVSAETRTDGGQGSTRTESDVDAGGSAEPGPRDADAPLAVRRAVRYEDVWFAYDEGDYDEGDWVLRGVSLEAGTGETLALVGPSGAGKSTLVDLLPRFVEPDRGRVTLDGTDLREIPLPRLRALMGIVSQETVVFHDTARANIAYGRPDRWSEEEIRRAARAAHADEFVRELPEGYDTPLGERGVRLSGGQRQRIGLARAVLRDPPILILDEATSEVDPESERLIRDALSSLLEGRTVFVVAHRLSTVRGADRILVLEEGEVVERGTHRELLTRGGSYRRLHDPQLAEGVSVGVEAGSRLHSAPTDVHCTRVDGPRPAGDWNPEAFVAERSDDWLAQAERDLENARWQKEGGFFEWACFVSQQAAEKAVKGVYQKLGAEAWGHSVGSLLEGLGEEVDVDDGLIATGRQLDRYYVPARYPNGWAEGSPQDYYTEDDADEAIAGAEEVVRFGRRLLAGSD